MSPPKRSDSGTEPRERPAAYHHGSLREALVQAAVDILEERGLAALSLRETARRAGVSHAAPYHHFQDKEALLSAVAARGFRMQSAAMEAGAKNAPPGVDPIQSFGLTYASFAQAHPSLFRLMYSHERSSPDTSPELVEASSKIYSEMVEGIRQRTGCGIDEAYRIALLFWSSMHGLAMLSLDGQLNWPGAAPLGTLAHEITELLGRVLKPPP